MEKSQFLENLGKRICSLPEEDIKRSLEYYSEMIDDHIESGLSEKEAIEQLGNMDEIALQILSEGAVSKIISKNARPRKKIGAWEIVLLILGSPIWLSLLISAIAVIISLYASLWSVIISLWAVFVSVAVCAPAGVIAGIVFALSDNLATGIAIVGTGIVCAGLAIFIFYGCKAATAGTLLLTKKITLFTKKCFVKKGRA